jgi:hypothetical protein
MHFNELTNYLAPFYQIQLDIMMFDVQYVKLIFIINKSFTFQYLMIENQFFYLIISKEFISLGSSTSTKLTHTLVNSFSFKYQSYLNVVIFIIAKLLHI